VIYFFILFHILLFLQCYMLYKKRLKKKGFILLIMNTFMLFTNMIKFVSALGQEYSTIIHFEQNLIEHSILGIIWILLNSFLLWFANYTIKIAKKKKVQNIYLRNSIYFISLILIFFFIIILFQKNANIIIFFLLIYSKLFKLIA